MVCRYLSPCLSYILTVTYNCARPVRSLEKEGKVVPLHGNLQKQNTEKANQQEMEYTLPPVHFTHTLSLFPSSLKGPLQQQLTHTLSPQKTLFLSISHLQPDSCNLFSILPPSITLIPSRKHQKEDMPKPLTTVAYSVHPLLLCPRAKEEEKRTSSRKKKKKNHKNPTKKKRTKKPKPSTTQDPKPSTTQDVRTSPTPEAIATAAPLARPKSTPSPVITSTPFATNSETSNHSLNFDHPQTP